MRENSHASAILYALLAAVFYAVSTPVSKLLLAHTEPKIMAALLYIGAGTGVGGMYLFRFRSEGRSERLTKADLPYTTGMIVLDIAAPILLMTGISTGSASNASLLGNFEIVATTLIALIIFREKVSALLWTAIGFITISSIFLSFEGAESFSFSSGSLFVIAATCCWGLENNCTRRISGRSTYEIVTLKGIFSGGGALIVALLYGEHFPEPAYIAAALALGFVSYGMSIFLYIRAQRNLGAAKTSAYYAVAPFIGSAFAWALNGEQLAVTYFAGLALMITGTVFLVRDTMRGSH